MQWSCAAPGKGEKDPFPLRTELLKELIDSKYTVTVSFNRPGAHYGTSFDDGALKGHGGGNATVYVGRGSVWSGGALAIVQTMDKDGKIEIEIVSGTTALGHEFVHALHALKGEILATHEKSSGLHTLHWDFIAWQEESYTWKDITGAVRTDTVTTEELRTTGLGRFANEHFSENALRAEVPWRNGSRRINY